MEATLRRTWKSVTAGVLNIISGAMSVFNVIGLVTAIAAGETWESIFGASPPEDLPFVEPLMPAILIILLSLAIIVAVFPIIGGVFALQRVKWGWALTGSIIAIIGTFPLGVASTIFVAMAKNEFE